MTKLVVKGAAIGLSIAMLVSGCSPSSESIEPLPLTSAPYLSLSCKQLTAEVRRAKRELESVTKVQDREHSRDVVWV